MCFEPEIFSQMWKSSSSYSVSSSSQPPGFLYDTVLYVHLEDLVQKAFTLLVGT